MVAIHILAGLLALAMGAVALYAGKGSPLHRKAGRIFVGAMLVMSGSGALMAVFVRPDGVNVVAALLTFYLVCTALLTVRVPVEDSREVLKALMVAALLLGAFAFGLALEAMNSPDGAVNGIPPAPLFMFGLVGVVAGSLDARLLWARRIQGTHRLARHVWRMGFALFIATASFFLGQAQVFPEPIRKSGVLAAPVVVVILVMGYWVLRVLLRGQRVARGLGAGPDASA